MIDFSSLQKTMYVDVSKSNDLDNNAGNVQISLTASQSNRKSNKSNINSQDEVTFNSDDEDVESKELDSQEIVEDQVPLNLPNEDTPEDINLGNE